MQIVFYALFSDSSEWREIRPAVALYLLYAFFPCADTGSIIHDHLGIGSELALPDGTMLRILPEISIREFSQSGAAAPRI